MQASHIVRYRKCQIKMGCFLCVSVSYYIVSIKI